MVIRTQSATHSGADGVVVEVEASLQNALPTIILTGLPGDVVKESRERIRACLCALGFDVPSCRAVVHLSPASARKQGSQLDLAVAIALLAAEGKIQPRKPLGKMGFLGELTLDGRIRGVGGALALAQALEQAPGIDTLFIPEESAAEVSLLASGRIHTAQTLVELIAMLEGRLPWQPVPRIPFSPEPTPHLASLDAVQGQPLAKRALEIALAGHHHLLFVGPPGVGKSLLASTAKDLLPPLRLDEYIHLVKHQGYEDCGQRRHAPRPFRSPHHSISASGLLGGGSATVVAGEVTLAHGGVLFLDEWPEFRKDALEGLREPLQSGEIFLNRVGTRLRFPARFLLIAAMNPCPCGFALDPEHACRCPPNKALSYRRRISGPLYDRMDLCVVLGRPGGGRNGLQEGEAGTPGDPEPRLRHASVRASIDRVRKLQAQRAGHETDLVPDARAWLQENAEREALSFRAMGKCVRVARTIADLAHSPEVQLCHLEEAWSLRCSDFGNWR